jgi:hypothetical protein
MVVSTYSLVQKNRWLHWLASQTFFAGQSHFHAASIQPEALSLKSDFDRLKSSVLSLVVGCTFGLVWGVSHGSLSVGQLLGQSLTGGIIGVIGSCCSPRIFYRLLLGFLAGSILGGLFGLVYGHILWPFWNFWNVSIAFPFDKSWGTHWERSLLMNLPNAMPLAINLGLAISFLTLVPHIWFGYYDGILWQSRIRFEIRKIGYAFLFSAIPAILLVRGGLSIEVLGFSLAFSSSLGFALALKARKYDQKTVHGRSRWVSIALANSCYLLLLLVPSAVALILYVGNDIFYTIQSYALVNRFFPQYPWLKLMRAPMLDLSMFTMGLYFGLHLGLIWVLRSRPVSALLSLLQYGALRLTIWIYGLGPLNYRAFLQAMVEQGILVDEPQGHRFRDAPTFEFYALTLQY